MKMLLHQQAFSRAPPNGSFWKYNKIDMLFLPNIDHMMVYWYTMVNNFLSVLAHKFTNISAESIAVKK